MNSKAGDTMPMEGWEPQETYSLEGGAWWSNRQAGRGKIEALQKMLGNGPCFEEQILWGGEMPRDIPSFGGKHE